MAQRTIPGYAYGSPQLARSPVTLEELEQLKATITLGEEDVAALRRSRDVLAAHVNEILDVWYGFVGAQPHLLAAFCRPSDGQPQEGYLAAVRERFGQWVLDTAAATFDQAWLDWQHEIALRHHRSKKNQTDHADAAAIVPFSYMVALLYPLTATLRPFLARGGHAPEEVEAMYQAWVKAVLLQVILWSHPYVIQGDF